MYGVGFLTVEVVPSPKFHFHEVGLLILLSVKVTVNGAFPDVGYAEKFVTGAMRGPINCPNSQYAPTFIMTVAILLVVVLIAYTLLSSHTTYNLCPFGVIETPDGRYPAETVSVTVFVVVSITETVLS